MIIRIPSRKGMKYIDGEFLYDYYFRVMGSARSQRKLPAVAEANGIKNFYGESPSFMGCWKSMWRWACEPENHQKAYELYNNAMQDYGLYYTFDEFKQILREKSKIAVQFKNEHQRDRFWKRNGLL